MTKPLGRTTRGFTAQNRLRLVDTFVLIALREHLRQMDGLFVDLGYGAQPVTTLESFDRFRQVRPGLQALGVEIDPERVEAALPFRRDGLEFRRGGFNVPLAPGEKVSLVRMFNVLRQYDEPEIAEALGFLATSLAPGAWLIEGTSDPPGRHVCFWAWQRDCGQGPTGRTTGAPSLQRHWLVFGARLHGAFNPRQLQPYLPKELIHHAEPGGHLDGFFAAWERAWLANPSLPPRQRWVASARRLACMFHGVDLRPALLSRRLLAVRPETVLAGGCGEVTSRRPGRRDGWDW